MPNTESNGSIKTYSLLKERVPGTSGTGWDQFLEFIQADAGLAGATDGKDIAAGADAADRLNRMILDAANATGAAADGRFTVDEVVAMNAYLRADPVRLAEWTALHGDDENGEETGFHLVQNDGANTRYRNNNLVDTVIDGVYHMGFTIQNGRFLNEDDDENAALQDVADWLTQFYTDHSTTGTGLDRITNLVMADAGLDANICDPQIAAGADAADGMNRMIVEAINATGALSDDRIDSADLVAMNAYLRADPARLAQWTALHGDDENGEETGFHLVQNDGAHTKFFGQNLVNTVADGIYHMGFTIENGRFFNEDGDANAKLTDVADWMNYFYVDQSSTGTGLDRIVDIIKSDRGLAKYTSARDIVAGAQHADDFNHLIVDLIRSTGADADKWITTEDLLRINAAIRSDAALLARWTALHGDDENGSETGYHLVQNDGANTQFFGRNLVDTVADGIYHLGFEIRNGRFLNEDGNGNATLEDVASWLNFFYGEATLIEGQCGDDAINGDDRSEQINAGGGNDIVNAAGGDDLIYGSWGNDAIDGGAGNDIVYGGNGNDALSGGEGDDVFRVTGSKNEGKAKDRGPCFEGWDSYDGGAGNDSIVATGGKVDIGLTGFSAANGIETIDATGATGPVRLLGDWNANILDFSGVTILGNVVIDGGGGDDVITGSAGDDVIVGGDWGNQAIDGGAGNDTIIAGKGNDSVAGGAGDDVFRVGGFKAGKKQNQFEGWDSYDGGAGNDAIVATGGKVDIGLAGFSATNGIETIDATGATGPVRLLGDWNANILDFSGVTILGNIVIDGGGGDDVITGSAGDDVIVGGDWGNQAIDGGAGNDTIIAGKGNDAVFGDDGDDTIRVSGNVKAKFEGWDSYDGGAGNDRIVASGKVDIGLTAFSAANGIEAIVGQGQVRLLGDWNANVLDFSGVTITGNIVINGGGGDDVITGSAGNDVIVGGDWGSQAIDGGAGNDTIIAGKGDDSVAGGDGDDTFRVGGNVYSKFEGWDSYDGGAGNDRIVASGKVDIGLTGFSAASGIEAIVGQGQVRLLGDWNASVLDFSGATITGNVVINGGGGDDVIIGTAGRDVIKGGDWGNQAIDGGAGSDDLSGGSGADKYCFTSALNAATNVDRIRDFVSAIDQFMLDADIFGGLPVGTLSADAFASGKGRTAATNESQRIIYNLTNGMLYWDADGKPGSGPDIAPVAFAQIVSPSKPALSASDFQIYNG
jgi:Ca2+-binding RTX toxin-like protein